MYSGKIAVPPGGGGIVSGVLKYMRRFMLSNLPNLFKNRRSNFKKASLHMEKTVINRLLHFSIILKLTVVNGLK
jgi:threonine dehydratase